MRRASSSFASIGSPSGTARLRRPAATTRAASRRGSASSCPNCSSGGCGERDVVPDRRAHLLGPSQESEQRRREHDLRLEAVVPPSPCGRRAGCRAGRCRRARRRPRPRPSRTPASAGRGARRRRSAAPAANRFAKSSRSRSCATVIVRVSRTTSAKSSVAEPLAVEPDLRALAVEDRIACSTYVCAFCVDLLVGEDRAARPSGRTGRRSASCSRRRSGRRCALRPGTRASAAAGSRGRRGCPATVTSMPSFTRSGRPSFSFAVEAAVGQEVDGVAR